MHKTAGDHNNKLKILTSYFFIYVVWGSTYYFIGLALKGFPTFLLGAIRFSTAGAILLGWCRWKGESLLKKGLMRQSAISGIILLFIDMAVVMVAQRYVTSSLVAIIASSTAIWIMLLDVPMWRKNFRSPFVISGIVIGFLGVSMLYFRQDSRAGLQAASATGISILLFGCISWALGTLYTKYRSAVEEIHGAFAGSAWQMFFAGGMFWICSIARGELSSFNPYQVSAGAWYSLSYLIIFGSLLAYSAYIWLLKVRPATEVATHAYVNPFIAVFLGKFLGNEEVTFMQLSGLVIIVLSIILVSVKSDNIPNPPEIGG